VAAFLIILRWMTVMFRILSLDGGGIRGAFAAALLARLEQELATPITDYFDLIAGTSTGGIIALALGLGEPAEKISRLYKERGREIFTRRKPARSPWLDRLCIRLAKRRFPKASELGLYRSKYDSGSLKKALEDVFGDRTLDDARASRLVLPAVNLVKGRTVVFKTPHQPKFIRDRYIKAVDVALAVTAAPSFFPQHSIHEGSSYADGGLWANNPALIGFAEALKIQNLPKRDQIDEVLSQDDIHILSIGTGEPEYYAQPKNGDDGLLWWATRLFDVGSGAQSQGTDCLVRYIVGESRYKRIDFRMPSNPWPLDEVNALTDLIHFGEEEATGNYPTLKDWFFSEKKASYHPFPPK
jgi:uncharacterized protein